MYGKGNNHCPVVSIGKAQLEHCVWLLCLVIVLHEVYRNFWQNPEESTQNDKGLRKVLASFDGLFPYTRTKIIP